MLQVFSCVWTLALTIRSLLQAEKLLKTLKAHLKQEAEKEKETQVSNVFLHYLLADKQSWLVNTFSDDLRPAVDLLSYYQPQRFVMNGETALQASCLWNVIKRL